MRMHWEYKQIPEELSMSQNNYDFTSLEDLELACRLNEVESSGNFILMLSRFKELKNFQGDLIDVRIENLLDILRFLGDWKTLNISVSLKMNGSNYLNKEATKDIFLEALEIVKEKFPFPDARIRRLEIEEGYVTLRYKILYGESGAVFTEHQSNISDFNSWANSKSSPFL